MNFIPNKKTLIVKKNVWKDVGVDMYIAEDEEDKALITCTVDFWTEKYVRWDIVVVGKYSLYTLKYEWEKYYLVDEDDILWEIN
jgi:hypothetical protein